MFVSIVLKNPKSLIFFLPCMSSSRSESSTGMFYWGKRNWDRKDSNDTFFGFFCLYDIEGPAIRQCIPGLEFR